MKTIAKPVITKLKPGEKNIGLQEAIEKGFLEDLRHVWVVSGQYIYKDATEEDYPYAMTSVYRAAMETDKYMVHTSLGSAHAESSYYSKKELREKFPELYGIHYYTKKELREKFPELFRINGQLLIQ